MDKVFSALLSNLSYELLGVFIPGAIGSLFLILWLEGMGGVIPFITLNVLPDFSVSALRRSLESLSLLSGISVIVPVAIIWYFLGHLLLWIGRHSQQEGDVSIGWRRVLQCMFFNIPHPQDSFDADLKPMEKELCKKFSSDNVTLEWRQFYPVAKSYISEHAARSLVYVYQNKYTLHRSIVSAGALLFWASALGLVAPSLLGLWFSIPQPNFPLLSAMIAGSLLLIWGFSGSYAYHWTMFGNSIVTELYGLMKATEQGISKPE